MPRARRPGSPRSDRIDVGLLARYHLLPAARADFRAGSAGGAEAAAEYRAALRLVDNTRERAFLRRRLAECEIATTAGRRNSC